MSALQLVPEALPTTTVVHHPSCPMRTGEVPCICPTSSAPLDEETCPSCAGDLQVWQLFSPAGWTEWLACLRCAWREQL